MNGDRAPLAVIAGAVALIGWLVPAAPAREFEPSSVEQAPSAIAVRQMPCSAASTWSREAYMAFATCEASIHGLEPILAQRDPVLRSFRSLLRAREGHTGKGRPGGGRAVTPRDVRVFRPFAGAGEQPGRGKACLRTQVFRARPTLYEMRRLSKRGAGQADQNAPRAAVSRLSKSPK